MDAQQSQEVGEDGNVPRSISADHDGFIIQEGSELQIESADLDMLRKCLDLELKAASPPDDLELIPVIASDISCTLDLPDNAPERTVRFPVRLNLIETLATVFPPPQVIADGEPDRKRRKLKPGVRRNEKPLVVFNLPPDQAADLHTVLAARRIKQPVVYVQEPCLSLSVAGSKCIMSLQFGTSLVKNGRPYAPHQLGNANAVAFKLFGHLLNRPGLDDFQGREATGENLFEVLTRSPTVSLTHITHPKLITPLLPFQCESVRWCLRKEGKDIVQDTGKIIDLDPQIRDYVVTPPLGWSQVEIDGKTIWANPYKMQLQDSDPIAEPYMIGNEYCGRGLLAEEMGLGKTVEMIAVLLLNPRPPITDNDFTTKDPFTDLEVIKIKATLVIAPSALIHQWKNELSSHAPTLKVFIYKGRNAHEEPLSADQLMEYDVVLTSYTVIGSELHSATFNPGQRNTRFWRERKDIEAIRSPLVQVQFWRVLLDEVQMVHSGVSNAAKVARIVPRVHAWGVTGTPIKTAMSDLRGILYFLDMNPFVEGASWSRMLASPDDFELTMSTIGIRHTKPMVAGQLTLPPQKRHLITLDFSPVERHNYDSIYEKFLETKDDERELGKWLGRLRQACCYASVTSSVNWEANSHLLTVSQVLAKLIDEAETELEKRIRESMVTRLELGQFLDKADRMPDALKLWKSIAQEQVDMLAELGTKISEREQDRDECEKSLQKVEAELEKLEMSLLPQISPEEEGGNEETRLISVEPSPEDSAQLRILENRVSDAKVALNNATSRLRSLKSRVRSLEELLHRTYFFLGTGYYRLTERTSPDEKTKEENSTEEKKYYDLAEELRSALLSEAETKVTQMLEKITQPSLHRLKLPMYMMQADLLNEQADFIEDLRDQLMEILRMPLLEQDEEEVEKEAYAESLDSQEKGYVLLDMIQLLLKDRSAAIAGGRYPVQPREGNEPWSEFRQDMMMKRAEQQIKIRRLDPYAQAINVFRATGHGELLRSSLEKLRENLKEWQKEEDVLRELFNNRLEYFKQLQMLSDRVVDPDIGDNDIKKLIQNKRTAVGSAERRMAIFHSKLRYLQNIELRQPKTKELAEDSSIKQEDEEMCIICQDRIIQGSLTICGHKFCTACLIQWFAVRNSSVNSCPLCKTVLTGKDIFRFKMDGEEGPEPLPQLRDLHNELYTQISNHLYNEILVESIARNYGAKCDMIVRHAQHLRRQNPNTQIVLFSQFAAMLKVIASALNENGLATATVNDGTAEFCRDSSIACFLLHTKANAAGLTLVNATHVFLCEPLINTALELQAISRIHRIGQTRTTNVWLFSVDRTVEHAILNLTSERRVKQISALQDRRDTPSANEDAAETAILAGSSTTLVDRSSGSEVVLAADMKRVLYYSDNIKDEPTDSNQVAHTVEPVEPIAPVTNAAIPAETS